MNLVQKIGQTTRSYDAGRTTNPNHRDPRHKAYLEWQPEEALRAAESIGPACSKLLEKIFEQDTHIDHRKRASQSLQNMARTIAATTTIPITTPAPWKSSTRDSQG